MLKDRNGVVVPWRFVVVCGVPPVSRGGIVVLRPEAVAPDGTVAYQMREVPR